MPGAEQAALLGVPRGEQDAPLRPPALLRRERVGLGDLDQRHHTRSVVVGAVEDLRRVGAVVIVVRGDEDPFVFQLRIAPFEQRDDVAIRHDVTVDRSGQGEPAARERQCRKTVRGFRRLPQFLERLAGACHERRGDGRRDLHDRNVNAVGPGRQRVTQEVRRLLRPIVARGRFEVRCAGVILDVADEHHRDRALLLRRQRLAPHGGRLGGDDAVERAVGIAFAWLVIEGEHDVALHIAAVVVVAEVRCADAESGEHDRSRRRAAGAEAVRVELLAQAQRLGGAIGTLHLKGVRRERLVRERRRHQVVRLEERATRTGALQAQALEPRSDEVGGGAILFRVRQAPAQRVAREKKQIGPQILLPDRLVLRCLLLCRDLNDDGEAHHRDERLLHAGDYAADVFFVRLRVLSVFVVYASA